MDTPGTAVPDVSAGSSPAPSSPAPAPISGQAVLDGMTDRQRDAYMLTGDLPSATSDDSTAAPSAAQPEDQAAATAASPTEAPASDTGKPGKERGAKARSAELDTEIQGLQERLRLRKALREELAHVEAPRRPDGPAASSPAPTQAEYKRYMAMPDAPQEADFESFAEFTAATSLFITDQRWQEHQTRARQDTAMQRHVQGVEQISQTATERIGKATAADPEFASKVNQDLLKVDIASVRRLNGEKVGPQHVLAEQIARSEHVDKLLLHFSSTEGVADWSRLCALPPSELFRAFGRLEARFEGASPATPAAPAPKHLSSANAPPTTVGSRPSEPIDPVEAALKQKDPAAYIAAANARDLAARR